MYTLDTTLRDGLTGFEPAPNFSVKSEILRLLFKLPESSLRYIEVLYFGPDKLLNDDLLPMLPKDDERHCFLVWPAEDQISAAADLGFNRFRLNTFYSLGEIAFETPDGVQLPNPVRDGKTLASIDYITKTVKTAKTFTPNVQWTAFDATRTDPYILLDAVEAVLEAGATTICIADTMAVATPDSFAELVKKIAPLTKAAGAHLGVHCHGKQTALANAFTAVDAGADQVEGSFFGIGLNGGNVDLLKIIESIYGSESNHYLDMLDTEFEIGGLLNLTPPV